MSEFQQGIEQYNKVRQEGELDLINEVRVALQACGLHQELLTSYETNNYIQLASDKIPEVQRHYLNRFWTIQLLNAKDSSHEERFCLIPDGKPDDWLRLFKQRIVPFAIKHRLPIVI